LDAMKKIWNGKLTTVFVRQGHYAHDPKAIAGYPPADITLESIGNALDFSLQDLVDAGQPRASSSTV